LFLELINRTRQALTLIWYDALVSSELFGGLFVALMLLLTHIIRFICTERPLPPIEFPMSWLFLPTIPIKKLLHSALCMCQSTYIITGFLRWDFFKQIKWHS
jgi:hypothetical protein